jgi:lysyl endopeptidase
MLSFLVPALAAASVGDMTVEPAFDVPATAEVMSAAAPYSLAEGLSLDPAMRLSSAELGAVDQLRELEVWNTGGGEPKRNGFSRRLPRAIRASFSAATATGTPSFADGGWTVRTVDQSLVWGTSIAVDGAWRTRIKLEQVSLPPGTRFWVWAPGEEQTHFGLELLDAEATIWTPSTEGELVYLEVAIPLSGIEGEQPLGLQINEVLQLFSQQSPESGECLIDATCVTTSTLDVIGPLRNAIAQLQFVKNGNSYVCSGGLLNDTDTATTIPYLLTANHCFSTQSVASTLEAFWDYRTTTCGGSWPNLATRPKSNGSTLLSSNAQSDFTLARLNSIPAGRSLLGWTTAAVANGVKLHRVSHPYPDAFAVPAPQSYSSTLNATSPSATCSLNLSKFLFSSMSQGGTYGGSSGSPVILAGGYVVGQLLGACGSNNEGCSPSHYTVDGKFSATYPAIQQYLDPNPEGGPCVPGPDTACLLGSRFKVEVEWTDFSSVTRDAHVASAGTSDTALFYWTNPNNWELLIKGINACSLNNKFWIYFAAATNVGYRVTVTDTQAGGSPKVYSNALGNLAQATNDINAFSCP